MKLGMEVDLSPGDIVLDGEPSSPLKRGTALPTFRPMSIVAKWSPIISGFSSVFFFHILCLQINLI